MLSQERKGLFAGFNSNDDNINQVKKHRKSCNKGFR